jgi:hypothetical protein
MLEEELAGRRPAFAAPELAAGEAPATRQFMREWKTAPAAQP